VLGIVGSIIGGAVTHLFYPPSTGGKFHLGGLIASIIGAILVLYIWHKFRLQLPRGQSDDERSRGFQYYLFPATGAVSCQTGATPQESKSSHEQALKARFNGAEMNGGFSADVLGNYESWDVAPVCG
jgi:Transglycosylase associated protein